MPFKRIPKNASVVQYPQAEPTRSTHTVTKRQTQAPSSTSSKKTRIAQGVTLFLTGVKESSDWLPPLKAAAGGTLWILSTVQQFKGNQKDWKEFGEMVASCMSDILERLGPDAPPLLHADIGNMISVLEDIKFDIEAWTARKLIVKAAQTAEEATVISCLKAKFQQAHTQFIMLSVLSTRQELNDIKAKFDMALQSTKSSENNTATKETEGKLIVQFASGSVKFAFAIFDTESRFGTYVTRFGTAVHVEISHFLKFTGRPFFFLI